MKKNIAAIQNIKLNSSVEVMTQANKLKCNMTDWDVRLAVLSQYFHNRDRSWKVESMECIRCAIREFLLRKKVCDKSEITDRLLMDIVEKQESMGLFSDFFDVPFSSPDNPKFTFIDLFAGMGGFRLALQAHGGKCVFSSEWNKYAQKTYMANFGEMPFGDITKEETKSYIPKIFDILCAGFPCQPFSIAGVSKKKSLGRETGFKDKTQGTLFFDVADIISRHRPKVFFLENVKNLVSHDKGNTFKIIKGTLEELRYTLHYKVLDGQYYVPQHRERIIIVGFNRDVYQGQEQFNFPEHYCPVKVDK